MERWNQELSRYGRETGAPWRDCSKPPSRASSVPVEPPPAFLAKRGTAGSGDSQFYHPLGVALDATGNVYVADAWNHRVNKFDANGTFLMIWGWGVRNGDDEFQVCTGGCMTGKQGDGDGQFSNPWDMVVDSAGNIWVAERSNNRIQKFDSGGNYLRHRGVWGSSAGQFKEPVGVAVDAAGNIFVTDRYNYRVQKFGGPWVEIFIGDPELLSGH